MTEKGGVGVMQIRYESTKFSKIYFKKSQMFRADRGKEHVVKFPTDGYMEV